MFKNFLIMSLTAMMSGSGCLPFVPIANTQTTNQEKYYCASNFLGFGTSPETHEVIINYDNYTQSYINIDLLVPNYSSEYGTNGCTPTAGNIITVYYDYFYPNLIPDYEPTYIYNNNIKWKIPNTTTANNQIELYNLMGTNTEAPGTSVAQFKNGMTSYYNSKGYNIAYNDVTNSLTTNNVINWFNQEKPIILFLTSYDFYPSPLVTHSTNQARLVGQREVVGHAVVACAYFEFTYYVNNTISRLDKYFYVAFGNGNYGFLTMNDTSYIEEAYTFDISARN